MKLEQPVIYDGSEFGEFRGESQPSSANPSALDAGDSAIVAGGGSEVVGAEDGEGGNTPLPSRVFPFSF